MTLGLTGESSKSNGNGKIIIYRPGNISFEYRNTDLQSGIRT